MARRARAGATDEERDAKRLRTGPAEEARPFAATRPIAVASAAPRAVASGARVDVQRVEAAPPRRWRRGGSGSGDGSDVRKQSGGVAPRRGAADNASRGASDPLKQRRGRRSIPTRSRKQRAADRRADARKREESALRAAIPRCARARALAPAMAWSVFAVALLGCALDVWRGGGVSVVLVGGFEALLRSRGARAAQFAAVGAANALLWRAVAVRRSAQRAASAP